MRGLLVVFEGLDRSGKTTQSNLLLKALEPSLKMNFPDRSTAVGGLISSYLQGLAHLEDHAVHLLFSANRWELNERLLAQLSTGTHVITDRYAYSGVAYSSAKGLDLAWCKSSDAGLLKPDLVVYLQMKPELAVSRGDYGEERYERLEFQRSVQSRFDELLLGQSHVLVLDAAAAPEAVAERVKSAVDALLARPRPEHEMLWS